MMETLIPAVVSILAAAIVGALVYRLEKKMTCIGKRAAAGIVKGIVEDEELMGELQDAIIKQINNHFASAKAGSARANKGFDRRLVKGVLDQNPLVSGFLESIGVLDYLQDHPGTLFYVLSMYPDLLNIGAGAAGAQTPAPLPQVINSGPAYKP